MVVWGRVGVPNCSCPVIASPKDKKPRHSKEGMGPALAEAEKKVIDLIAEDRSNMFFIEASLFFITVLVAPRLFFISVSVGASREGPGPCQRLACRSLSLASK